MGLEASKASKSSWLFLKCGNLLTLTLPDVFHFPFTFYWVQGFAQFPCEVCLDTLGKTARKPLPSLLNHSRCNACARKDSTRLEPHPLPAGCHISCVGDQIPSIFPATVSHPPPQKVLSYGQSLTATTSSTAGELVLATESQWLTHP